MKVNIPKEEPMLLEQIRDLMVNELVEAGFKCRLSAVIRDSVGYRVSC